MSVLRGMCNWMYYTGFLIVKGGDSLADNIKLVGDDTTMISAMWSIFSLIGISMVIIHFLLDLNEKIVTSGSNFTMQLFTFPMIKFLMALMIVTHGGGITVKVLQFGNYIVDEINTAGEDSDDEYEVGEDDPLRTMCDDWGIFPCLLGMIFGLVYLVICIVIHFIFLYKVVAYKIELIFRIGLAPLFMGDVADGFHSGAMRYWKRILGVMIYGAGFIAVIKIGALMMAGDGGVHLFSVEFDEGLLANLFNGLSKPFDMMIVMVAEIGVLGAIKQACSEIGQ